MTKYAVQVRNNTTLAIVDAGLDDWEDLKAIRRFNGVGSWVLTLRNEDPKAKLFKPDSSGALPNGILIWKDNEDGMPPQLFLSGPCRHVEVSRKEDSTGIVLAGGMCDNYWMQKRLAYPYPAYPYQANVINPSAPIRYYQLAEASGTTATDTGSQATNGTYSGAVVLGVPGLIDDPATCVQFNGSTTEVQVPTGSLPAANSVFSVFGWGLLTANPGGTVYLWTHGTNAAKSGVAIGITSAGLPIVAIAGGTGSATGINAVPLNTPFLLGMSWDGTTLTGYLNGVSFGTVVPGVALTIAYGFARIGDFLGASGFWPGKIGQVVVYSVTAATLGTDLTGKTAFPLWMYEVGASKHAYEEYEKYAFPTTSINIFNFVSDNMQYGGAHAILERILPGISMPTQYLQIGGAQTATWLARFDTVLELIQGIALASTPEVGFQLQQSGNQLVFSIYLPVDRTANAVFSLDRGSVLEYTWTYSAAEANFLVAGGRNTTSGSLAARTFGEGKDQTSINQFGRLEQFLEYRKTTDTVTMQNVMNAKLAQYKVKRNLNASVSDTTSLYFMGPDVKGYNLGDKVRVITEDGLIFDDIVREVQLDLTKGQPARTIVAIGTPIDTAIISEFDVLVKRMRDMGITTSLTSNNY